MAQDTSEGDVPQLSGPALAEWGAIVERTLRGVAHALNNRAAALSAVLELSRDPAPDDPPAIQSILGSELQRVSELVHVVRALGPPRSAVEAFAPADVVGEALAILSARADQRGDVTTIEAADAPPVRAPRWLFVRALVALGAASSDGIAGAKGGTSMAIRGDGDWVVVRVEQPGAKGTSLFASEAARAMAGEPLEGALGFRLPTLAALRRREAPSV